MAVYEIVGVSLQEREEIRKGPPGDEWISKMHTHTMEYHVT